MTRPRDESLPSVPRRLRIVDPAARSRQSAWGRIGGLRTRARHGGEQMTRAARSGFRQRFEREVDPMGVLRPAERARRADAALRAHMLTLAQRSAEARSKRATASERQRRVVRPATISGRG